MAEVLAAAAVVLALIAITSTLVLANELGNVRSRGLQQEWVGQQVTSETVRALSGRPVDLPPHGGALFLFAMNGCVPCETLLAALASSTPAVRAAIFLVARAHQDIAEDWAARASLARDSVFPDQHGKLSGRFFVSNYPTLMLTIGGRIQQMTPGSIEEIEKLAQLIVVPPSPTPPPSALDISGSTTNGEALG